MDGQKEIKTQRQTEQEERQNQLKLRERFCWRTMKVDPCWIKTLRRHTERTTPSPLSPSSEAPSAGWIMVPSLCTDHCITLIKGSMRRNRTLKATSWVVLSTYLLFSRLVFWGSSVYILQILGALCCIAPSFSNDLHRRLRCSLWCSSRKDRNQPTEALLPLQFVEMFAEQNVCYNNI